VHEETDLWKILAIAGRFLALILRVFCLNQELTLKKPQENRLFSFTDGLSLAEEER
jgi:hypothetical protein